MPVLISNSSLIIGISSGTNIVPDKCKWTEWTSPCEKPRHLPQSRSRQKVKHINGPIDCTNEGRRQSEQCPADKCPGKFYFECGKMN